MIREYDLVRLVEPFEEIPEGTQGTVLMIFGGGEAFEVEFPAHRHKTFTVPCDKLELAATGDWLPLSPVQRSGP
jgi:hypothetical protein